MRTLTDRASVALALAELDIVDELRALDLARSAYVGAYVGSGITYMVNGREVSRAEYMRACGPEEE